MIRVALRPKAAHPSRPKTPLTPRQSLLRVASWLGWPLWVWLSFMGAGLLCSAVLYLLFHGQESVPVLPLIMMQTAVYVVALALLIGLPWLVWRARPKMPASFRTTWRQLGWRRALQWRDFGWALVGFIIYIVLSMIALAAAKQWLPGFDATQAQNLGYQQLYGAERLLAFAMLVVVAPVAEELVFRGYLYSKLHAAHMPVWLITVVVSGLFGYVHGQLNVGIDVAMLSVVLVALRHTTGTIWPGILIHMVKNTIAFLAMFVFMVG